MTDPTPGKQLGEANASGMQAAALMLAVSVLLSRVVGYLREVALAVQVGVGSEADAYYTAFIIPDVLNYLLAGGALAIAFIPLYNRVRRRDGEAAGEELFSIVLGTLGALTLLGTVLLWIGADWIIEAGFPDFSPETRALTVRLTRIVLPAQVFFLTGGLLRAVLMAHGRFVAQAAAPLVYNGAVIIGGVLAGDAEGFAWGVLVGAFLGNWLIPLIEIRRHRSVRVRVAPLHPHFRAYIHLALPLMLGISLVTVDEWYEKFFGAMLAEGTVAQLSYARKLMMAPVAIVGQAVAAAALPLLSRLHAERRDDELNQSLTDTLRASSGLAIIAGAGCCVFAQPLVFVVYRYGRFSAEDAWHVSQLLALLSFAVPGWVIQQVAVRAFYAREEMWRPMLLGSAIALAAIPLYYGMAMTSEALGLAAAGVIAISTNAAATLVWARVRFGGPSLRAVGNTCGRALMISLMAGLVGGFVLGSSPGRTGALRDLLVGGGCFGAIAIVGMMVFGDAQMQQTLDRIFARLKRVVKRGGPA